jgi:hypothetical protein
MRAALGYCGSSFSGSVDNVLYHTLWQSKKKDTTTCENLICQASLIQTNNYLCLNVRTVSVRMRFPKGASEEVGIGK